MLPAHKLLRSAALHSSRAGTTFDPRTLILRFGARDAEALFVADDGAESARRTLLPDDSLITRIHEGIHWRQLLGTSLGAFVLWLRHAREREFFVKFNALPPARRSELLAQRRAGKPIIALTDGGMPEPPIRLDRPVDPVEMLRCVHFDSFTLETLFLDPSPLERPHAPLAEILSATIADAATLLADRHPQWKDIDYAAVQGAYTLDDTAIRRVRFRDPGDGSGEPTQRELTTHDILEAGAIANELMLGAFTRESVYRDEQTGDAGGISVWSANAEIDPEAFRVAAAIFLRSGHGVAARLFFTESALDAELPSSWPTLMAVCDFALNPPLPPLAALPARPPSWPDLYPPARFVLAARAARRIGGVADPPTHAALRGFHDALAEQAHLTAPSAIPVRAAPPGAPDFAALVREEREQELYAAPVVYYDFLVWAEARHAASRRDDMQLLVAPAYVARDRFAARDLDSLWRALQGLGFVPPVETDPAGELLHAIGSTPAFGSWFAASALAFGQSHDLAFGTGALDAAGFPAALAGNPRVRRLVAATLREALGEDP